MAEIDPTTGSEGPGCDHVVIAEAKDGGFIALIPDDGGNRKLAYDETRGGAEDRAEALAGALEVPIAIVGRFGPVTVVRPDGSAEDRVQSKVIQKYDL
jgi:hypothetical protein